MIVTLFIYSSKIHFRRNLGGKRRHLLMFSKSEAFQTQFWAARGVHILNKMIPGLTIKQVRKYMHGVIILVLSLYSSPDFQPVKAKVP
jgi:hypothetical protein